MGVFERRIKRAAPVVGHHERKRTKTHQFFSCVHCTTDTEVWQVSKKDKKCLFASSKNGVRILVAFVLGQCVQLVIHAVALDLWEYRQIPFCMAAGFIIFFAVLMGMRVAVKESKEEWGKNAEDWRP